MAASHSQRRRGERRTSLFLSSPRREGSSCSVSGRVGLFMRLRQLVLSPAQLVGHGRAAFSQNAAANSWRRTRDAQDRCTWYPMPATRGRGRRRNFDDAPPLSNGSTIPRKELQRLRHFLLLSTTPADFAVGLRWQSSPGIFSLCRETAKLAHVDRAGTRVPEQRGTRW